MCLLPAISPSAQEAAGTNTAGAPHLTGKITTLRYWDHEPFEDPLLRCLLKSFALQSGKTHKLVHKAPEALKEPLRYVAISSAATPFVIAVGGGRVPRIVVDTDADGDLAEETPVTAGKGKSSYGLHVFGPIALQSSPEAAVAKIRVLISGKTLLLAPAGYRSGRASLGGKRRRVALVDLDLDGAFSTVYAADSTPGTAPSRARDILAVDFNTDGNWDPASVDTPPEIQPLARLLLVRKTYYAVSIAPDGAKLGIAKTTPEMGTIDLGDTRARLDLEGDAAGLRLSTDKHGLIQLPTGRYSCTNVQLTDGRWTITGKPADGPLLDLLVASDSPLEVSLGAPLIAKADIKRVTDSLISIGAQLVGKGGELYSPGATKKGRRQAAPKLRVISEKGKELASGQFEYG